MDPKRTAPPGGAGGGLTLVRVKKTSGSAGTLTTQCSWVYSIYPFGDTTCAGTAIATGVTPFQAGGRYGGRATIGPYLYAPDASPAIATRIGGTWYLLHIPHEVLDAGACNCT